MYTAMPDPDVELPYLIVETIIFQRCRRCGVTGSIYSRQRGHVVRVDCPNCKGEGYISDDPLQEQEAN